MNNSIKNLCNFLDNGKSNYHVVAKAAEFLEENNFEKLNLSEKLNLNIGGKYYFENKGSIFAFRIDSIEDGFFVVGSHTDAPSMTLKYNPVIKENGYVKLNTEVYGGPILSTWFDRPLSMAGVVYIKGDNPLNPSKKLIDFEKPVCIIPNLAIHMNREINTGFDINKQKHILPVCSLEGSSIEQDFLLEKIALKLKMPKEDILDFEIHLYDIEKAALVGFNKEMLSSKKIDNISMLQGSLESLVSSKPGKGIKLVAGFDAEEIGSNTQNGADSDILANICERILLSFDKDREDYLSALEKSFVISADMAHAVHPNFAEKADPTNKPMMNKGIVIKQSTNKRYTSDAHGSSVIMELCNKLDLKYQIFVNRSDMMGGSTIGPISTSHFPVNSVDIGNPMLSMHSIRELMGTKDHLDMITLLTEFYSL